MTKNIKTANTYEKNTKTKNERDCMRVNKDLVQISLKQSNINPLVVQSVTT